MRVNGNPMPGQRDPSPRFQAILDEAGLWWPDVRECLIEGWGRATGLIDVVRGVREPGLYEATILAFLLDTTIKRVKGVEDE